MDVGSFRVLGRCKIATKLISTSDSVGVEKSENDGNPARRYETKKI